MPIALSFFLGFLFCSWFQCEVGVRPPYIRLSGENGRKLVSSMSGSGYNNNKQGREDRSEIERGGPLAYTKQGPVEGYMGKTSEGREVYMFTGIPYGEPPTGHLRFRDPLPRKPWRGVWKATSESPFCVQISGSTAGMIRGQEDCLYLDVHSPRIPIPGEKRKGSRGLPVIIWIPAGGYIFGRSLFYGSDYLLREDVIFVPINVRLGVLGYLASGDGASPGNWGLKDQALAVQWVHDNIEAFGGDPNRIIIGGISSGGDTAHAMLFTKYPARNHIKGIFGMSGTALANKGLDGKGRVQETSNLVAKHARCPTAAEGRSLDMVECLRRRDPYMLTAHMMVIASTYMPHMSQMFGPTVEPNVTTAFISELPETLYERGEVPPIPLILTRAEDETGFHLNWLGLRFNALPVYRLNWYKWMPILYRRLSYRNTRLGEVVPEEEAERSLRKLNKFYFGRDAPPRVFAKKDFLNFAKLANDGMYNVPMWKSLELHNKIGPTYSYLLREPTFHINPLTRPLELLVNQRFGGAHAGDFLLLFNNTSMAPPLKPGSDIGIASRNLINFIVNFAAYGKPLYRTASGKLLPLWETVGDGKKMRVLDVGLVNNISMMIDPLPATMRKKIWEQVKF